MLTTEPTAVLSDSLWAAALTAEIRDEDGTLVDTSTIEVTVSVIADNGALLTGTTTRAAVAGQVSFADVGVDRPVIGARLVFTAAGLAPDTTVVFNVTAPLPARVEFVVSPDSGIWGMDLAGQPSVRVVDLRGDLVDTVARTVVLSLIDAGGAMLEGLHFDTTTAGVASFSGLQVDRPVVGARLVVTAAGLAPDTTPAFTVAGDSADHLVFTAAPAAAHGGAPFTPVVTVEARTAAGRLVTWKGGTATITQGPGGGTGTLLGTTTQGFDEGTATFAGLRIDSVGAGYNLIATSAGLAPDTTAAFAVNFGHPSAGTSTLVTTDTILWVGDSALYTLTARDAGGNPLIGIESHLQGWPTVWGAFGTFTPLGGNSYQGYFRSTAATVGFRLGTSLAYDSILTTVDGTPVLVVGVGEVTTGDAHTCATLTNGWLYCWGESGDGRIGLGAVGDTALPVRLGAAFDWTSVRGGWQHTCGLRTITSTLWCWGDNSWGQLVTGDNSFFDAPHQATGSSGFTQVATGLGWSTGSVILDGGYNTCVRRFDDTVWCAGDNRFGQVGDGAQGFFAEADTLKRVGGGQQFYDLAVGAEMACGLLLSGHAWCWGGNSVHQLGRGTTTGDASCPDGNGPCRLTPVAVNAGPFTIGSLDAGLNFTCALTGGIPYCWGGIPFAGGGSLVNPIPASLPIDGVVEIDVGAGSVCGRLTDGRVGCWGSNDAGQLGDASVGDRTSHFEEIAGGRTYSAVDVGGKHACAIQAVSQRLWCWGANSSGQLGDGTRDASNVPVEVRFTL